MINWISNKSSVLLMSLFIALIPYVSMAQVGIGTEAPSAGLLLDVKAAPESSGVVLPDVDILDLFTVDPLPLGTELGTLVFNTNTSTGKGYYFWDGTAWTRFNAYIGQMAKYSNPSAGVTGPNMNSGGGNVRIVGNTEFSDNPVLYQASGNTGITVNETGIYQVTVALSLVGTYGTTGTPQRNSRAEIDIRIRVNGADRGPLYRSTEMNMTATAGDVDNGSLSFTQSVKIDAGQTITLRYNPSKNENVGIVRLRSLGTSTIFIQKLL
ncbi:hypothetical protein AAU57_13340 [Nonlabens sp. YIK11]|uniref:hypothetical protein n=1 Tax=Nonlabens sp. YIK11 TaxID=1453349 RepID=UPI0006DC2530|nr:hypothetical protein [Nonlabens sp. YIK11]KQC34208.1 hypothetical protein AAU57_13340 [Nonlabens sp. YIK11]